MQTKQDEAYNALTFAHDCRLVRPNVVECFLWAADRSPIGLRDVTVRKDGQYRASAGGKRVAVTMEKRPDGPECVAMGVASYRHGKYRAICTFA